MHMLSATKGHAQLVKIKQQTSKSVVLSRIFTIAHLLYQDKTMFMITLNNQLRSKAMRATAWYCIRAYILSVNHKPERGAHSN
uniref:Uncharacterized protein n=1 Tax=Octopus bimaculoides TaxID=37653 RepID=A0A0L8FGT8_OCTBM